MSASNDGFHQQVPNGLFKSAETARGRESSRPTAASGAQSCPACGERVLRINAFCLHCGHDLPRDAVAHEENRTFQLFTPIMVCLVLIGAAGAVWIGIDLYLLGPVEQPVTFDSNATHTTHTTCFSADDSQKVQALLAEGYEEVRSNDEGLRCFSK